MGASSSSTELFLLDTNVVSEMTRPVPSRAVRSWLDRRRFASLYISELSIGEIHQGIVRMPPSKRRAEVENWLERMLLPAFRGRILPIDQRVWITWGRVCGEGLRRGKPLPKIDAIFAAIAIEHDLTLASRDRGLHSLGIKVVDPWRGRSAGR